MSTLTLNHWGQPGGARAACEQVAKTLSSLLFMSARGGAHDCYMAVLQPIGEPLRHKVAVLVGAVPPVAAVGIRQCFLEKGDDAFL